MTKHSMTIEPRRLSSEFQVRFLDKADIPDILALCRKNSLYYHYCPPAATEQSILQDMEALPPGRSREDKYYIGYFEKGHLMAVMDLITHYPEEGTAYIGFFMTEAARQHQGVGSGIIEELCEALREMGYKSIRLAWVQGNPQAAGFWRRNGFAETGAVHNMGAYTVVEARREL